MSTGEILTFSDAEPLRALEAITKRKPAVVALERVFAVTPRGAALINRIKADPALGGSEIRVVSHDADDMRVVSPTTAGDRPAGPGPGGLAAPAAVIAPAAPLDQRGTRRAARFKVAGVVEVATDGNAATLIDLSTVGAQIVSTTILKPNQKVRMTVADDQATLRFNAIVAWAFFEMPPKTGPRYRAGIEFLDVNRADIEAFGVRHRA